MNLLDLAAAALAEFEGTPAAPAPAPIAQQPLSGAEAASDEPARRWQVCFPDIDPMEVIFCPEATRTEVATLYPGARLDVLSDSQGPMPIPGEADGLPGPVGPYDDRRTCRQCANLTAGGRCLAATRGELSHVARRNYSPVPGLPCRCVGYLPRADDPDRRPGRERWPFLLG